MSGLVGGIHTTVSPLFDRRPSAIEGRSLPLVNPGRTKCVELPLCFDLDGGATSSFFNKQWVQNSLGLDNVSFELIDLDVGERWLAAGKTYVPVTRELTWLLDQTDIGVLFLNGNNDIIM